MHTPAMDGLASTSLVFDRAYCQIAVCAPSRTSLLTGRRPDTNHVWRISADEVWRNITNATTIPQYFKENGYKSIGMGKIFHPGVSSGFDDVQYSWSLPYFDGRNNVRGRDSWRCFPNIVDNDLDDGQVADHAVSILQELKQNRTDGDTSPFFLAVGFHKPHLPFFVPANYCNLYPEASSIELARNPRPPIDLPPIAWTTSQELRTYDDMQQYNIRRCRQDAEFAMNSDECQIGDDDARLLRRGYYAAVSFADAQLGRVLAELENQGLGKNTIIVLWGDHGWKLGELNMWTKFTNLESDTRVPFMLRVPGMTDGGMRTSALVELIDIFPSLAELAGLEVPPLCPDDSTQVLTCVEGSSVAPLLTNQQQQWKKAAFSQYPRPLSGLSSIPDQPTPFDSENNQEDVMGYAIRVDDYRFVEWYSFDRVSATPDFNTIWGTELYNHTSPAQFFNQENNNLAGAPEMSDKVRELRQVLQAGWRSALPPNRDAQPSNNTGTVLHNVVLIVANVMFSFLFYSVH